MNIETIIQNCGTYIVIGQIREGKRTEINRVSNQPSSLIFDYLHATTAGHIGHFAGNPAHGSIQNDFNSVMKILDVTADEFTPVNKHAESHKK